MRDLLMRRMEQSKHRADLLALLVLFILPLLWFAPVLFPILTGQTLLPFDNLYSFEPWRTLQPGLIPHNQLLSDLVLENAVWKLHIRRTLLDGQLPLWNPQIFTGIPFLAAGQASTFYPLNILFYVLPLHLAYGWFTALQVALAGMGFYAWARTLRLRPLAALGGGVIYMFSGFLIASVVFTMFVAAVPWLPMLLAVIEWTIRKQEAKGAQGYNPLPYIAAGAATIGMVVLAGHPELIYYTLLVAGLYTVVRLGVARQWIIAHADRGLGRHINRRVVGLGVWLLVMALLGIALGGVQLLPLLELLPLNFREGSASLAQVRAWAWPDRHFLTFWLPDIFGNPSHHQWFDIWAREWRPAQLNTLGEPVNTIFWGIKNYVEGANYLGILTWLLAAVSLGYGTRQALMKRSPINEQSSQPLPSSHNVSLRAKREIPSGTLTAAEAKAEGDSSSQTPRNDALTADSSPFLRPWIIWFCAGLALISLLFAFGTPLYALLYYGLPGWNQLHSPFRWVFPFTLSMAMLAAVGLHLLPRAGTLWSRRYVRGVASGALLAGLVALGVVALSLVQPDRFRAVGEWLLASSDLARATFEHGDMAWSYEALNLARFGLWAVVSGLWLWFAPQSQRRWAWLAVAILVGDLYLTHGKFNPAAPVALSPVSESGTPPVVNFMQEREAWPAQADALVDAGQPLVPWRFTTFNVPGEKTFSPNVGMYYGWHDLRGYDSIIPRQYVQMMDQIAPQADMLLYNQIAPLQSQPGGDVYAVLDNPLLDLLNVKYILTEHHIPNPGWTEVYRDPAIGVYENAEAYPRAWIVPEAQVVAHAAQPLLTSDLRRVVYLDATPTEENALVPASPELVEANISRYTANDIFVDVNLSDRGWLVVGDAYFPGWKAFVRPFGTEESDETEVPIYRADGALRAVYLPEAGQWTVRLVYSPMSFKLGLYTSFLAMMTLLLLGLYWLWGRYYHPESTASEARTVAKNSLVPMGLSLTNKAIDFAFAMLYVRLLGPVGTGQYAFVVTIYGFFEIISRYGLGTLLTRDVAADKEQSSRYLTNVMLLRTLLWFVSLPLLALVVWGYRGVGNLAWLDATSIGTQEIQAITIFAFAMLFANWADALSSLFYAFEKMEYPAGLTNAIALFKVTLGALVLLLGWGYVGLAMVSLAMNILQTVWLYILVRSTLFRPQWQPDRALQRSMLKVSGPLMINHLLATIFWRIDIWILRPLAGAASVGLYSVGLKYLDGLNIVPSVFTMAIFPLMSRYARQSGDNLLRSYILSLRLLVLVSLPIAMLITALAAPLVWLVGGAQYLHIPETISLFGREITYFGGSDLALRVIIWSIPIGFVNSVTQYVLIAVNQQHYLTRAFILGVVFNIVGNLLVIPRFGYVGAAIVTILSEFSLLFPFYMSVRRNVGVVPWVSIFARPLLATVAMGGAIYALTQVGVNLWLAAPVGVIVYALVLWLLGALRGEEMQVLRRALVKRG